MTRMNRTNRVAPLKTLTITVRQAATGPVVAVVGDLDYDTAGDLRARLAEIPLTAGERLVVELAGMEFCDSTGITALIAARNHALAANAGIALAAVPEHTLRVLNLVGLDQVFALYDSTGEATSTGDPADVQTATG
ncbi:STAS domain-containing protein [Streptomyces sp. NPDC087440]|uniref:STAS domain-containing protein n=1 Tax=Streptomyces sp. NPDC087440 TaxID=3365790 RepID=UPI00381CA980